MEINVVAILLQMVNFGIVVGALTYFLLKPAKLILDERSRRIAQGQAAAEAALKEKEQIADLKKKAEREAKQEAKSIVAAAQADYEKRRQQLRSELKAEIEAERQKMLAALSKEKEAALNAMQAEFTQAVVTVAEQVMGSAIDAKKHQQLIADGLKAIAQTK